MNIKVLDINSLSPHLFWDVEKSSIIANENRQFIVQRILEYGLLSDWVQLYHSYGLDEISSIAMQIKDLDARSLSFISALSKKPKEQFRCFTTKQSMPKHWNF